jgi:hypothetical protein
MGGGSKLEQTNTAQAGPAFQGGMNTAGTAQQLGTQYNQQQQQLYEMLWGSPASATGTTGGAGGGTRGAVASMLDPSKLNVSSPTGVFGLQNTRANEAAAKQYASNAGDIKQRAANAGFGPGTPAGFVQNQLNQNARSLADTRGSNFLNSTTNQYDASLANFWKAANLASGGAGTAQQGALGGTGTAANVYNNLYGTAGHGNVVPPSGTLNALIGAGGTVGAAAVCCVAGTKVKMANGSGKSIELLVVGDEVASADGGKDLVTGLTETVRLTLRLATSSGHSLECSYEHALLRPSRGYVNAHESLDEEVMTGTGTAVVNRVEVGHRTLVYSPELSRTHTYLANGLWSEGW